MTTYREHGQALIAELESHGIRDAWIDLDGKHARVRFALKGQNRFFVFPKSSSDRRGLQNSLTDLRKLIGVRRPTKKSTRGKRQRNRVEAPVTSLSLTVPGGDPFEGLRRAVDPLEAALWRLEERTKLAEYRLSFFPGSFKEWQRAHP